MLTPVVHSLFIAVGATVSAFFLILPLSYAGAYKNYRGKIVVETVLLLPLILPPTIVGFGLLRLFGRHGLFGKLLNTIDVSLIFSLSGAMLATMIVVSPLLYQGMKGALASVPSSLIYAADTLSANTIEKLFLVILPNCWQSIVASVLLAFCRGLGEFGASLMVAGYIEGKTDTIATAIYFAVQQGNNEKALMLSLINVVMGLIILMIIQLLTRKKRGM